MNKQAYLCVDMSFHFSWINTWKRDFWILGLTLSSFCQLGCLPFYFLPAASESHVYSAFLAVTDTSLFYFLVRTVVGVPRLLSGTDLHFSNESGSSAPISFI
jgi:hypothetical protein